MHHDFQIFKSNYSFTNYLLSVLCFEIEMDMPIRIKRSLFYFKLNVIVEIRLLAKIDYCTILYVMFGTNDGLKNKIRCRTSMSASTLLKCWSVFVR